MTSVGEKSYLSWKNRSFKALTNSSSYKSDNEDHEDLLALNKPPVEPSKTLSPEVTADVAQYTKKDLEQII